MSHEILYRNVYNPFENGLTVSQINLWLIDKVAYELQYLRGLEAVEDWNKALKYGNLVGAGYEGFIKTKEQRGASRFIEQEVAKQVAEWPDAADDIAWWANRASHTSKCFGTLYGEDLEKYHVDEAETRYRSRLCLPDGRSVCLSGYMDGEGEDIILEGKCRSSWDEVGIVHEIKNDLQYNFYLHLYYIHHGKLPSKVWYQHTRRPCGFGFRGPRKKKSESLVEFGERIDQHMTDNPDYYFFRLINTTSMDEFERFCHATLYPIITAMMDWYDWMLDKSKPNSYHWMTPYGLYNPFMEGTQERFRQYRLHGTTAGLRPTRNTKVERVIP